jgi:glucokinase-like ROK family protein
VPIHSEAVSNPPLDSIDSLHAVLHAIRVGACRSRTEVAAETGLGRGLVAQRVAELVDLGLLLEEGTGASTGGRHPRHFSFNAAAGSLLVADLGATSVDVAVADLGGRILAHGSEPADIATGPEAVLSRVAGLLGDLRAQMRNPPDVWGIGVGLPGPVEFDRGRPAAPPIMPGWDDYPVRDRLAAALDAPVWVDNDVNVMALGEWSAGVAKGHQNAVFVKVGTGIGAGLISAGKLHRGFEGSAGDLGHIQVAEDGTRCRCGNVGCLEAIAGGHAIGRDGEALARAGGSEILASVLEASGTVTARDVGDAAARGDAAATALFERSARYVGTTIAAIVNLFNPSVIVLGGGVAAVGDRYLAAIRRTVYRRSLPLATRRLQIVPSGLGPMAGVVGAAAMVAGELFSREQLAMTLARRTYSGAERDRAHQLVSS